MSKDMDLQDSAADALNTTVTGIDERAVVHPSAKIGKNVSIGPWTMIGPNVEIGEGTQIGPHVVIKCNAKIGKHNKIYQFSSLADDPQHVALKGEGTRFEMGDHNIIREFVSISRGTETGDGVTRIGDHNFLMAYVHLGHDCVIENHTVIVNHATLAGHVTVRDYATLGAFTTVHQFAIIGQYSFVSHACMVFADAMPYVVICGHAHKVYGLNLVGLRRRGFSNDTLKKLKKAYRIIFREGTLLKDIVPKLQPLVKDCPEVQLLIDAVENSERGIIRNT